MAKTKTQVRAYVLVGTPLGHSSVVAAAARLCVLGELDTTK